MWLSNESMGLETRRLIFISNLQKEGFTFQQTISQFTIIKMESEGATSAGDILSSMHGRMRRAQRLIDKRDLQAVVRHGKCEVSYNQRGIRRLKYTFADIVYITDETSSHEITSWAIPGAGLDVRKHPISKSMTRRHEDACHRISTDKGSWTSVTIL